MNCIITEIENEFYDIIFTKWKLRMNFMISYLQSVSNHFVHRFCAMSDNWKI